MVGLDLPYIYDHSRHNRELQLGWELCDCSVTSKHTMFDCSANTYCDTGFPNVLSERLLTFTCNARGEGYTGISVQLTRD